MTTSKRTMRKPSKVGKFGNVKTAVDGIEFDSKLEAKRYTHLKLLRYAKQIKDFKMQVTYPLAVNGQKICDYRADFVVEQLDGSVVVEDTKGFVTAEFKLKKKLMKAVLGIDVIELYAKDLTRKPKRKSKISSLKKAL